MGVRLPAEYQEVEYLESTGAQFLHVPFRLKSSSKVKTRFAYRSLSVRENGIVFGARTYSGDAYNAIGSLDNIGIFMQWGSGSQYYYAIGKRDVDFHNVECDFENKTITIDGVLHQSSLQTEFSSVNNDCYVFAANTGSLSPTYKSSLRLWSLIVVEDGKNVLNLVPCYRKSDDEPGMYDLVSKQFFTNAGTGEFLVGPDVIDSISPLMVAWRRGLMMQKPKAYLYNYGEVGEFTGGFDIPREVWSGYNTFPTIEQDYVQFTGVNNVNIFLPFRSAIDLSNYKNLVMDVEIESTLSRYLAVRGHVQSQPNTSSSYELVRTPSSTPEQLLGRTQIKIDVSAINQSAYVYFAVGGSSYYKWKLYRAWLE